MTQNFSHQTVLVTGAAGFLGSHLCDQLLAQGATVIGVDNFLTGSQQNIDHLSQESGFTFISADVTQEPTAYLPADVKIDVILHFASPASPPIYQKHPVATYLVNSLATHYLAQYLLRTNPQGRLLFASTSEVYGDPAVHPQPESYWGNVNPNGVRSCYDEAKRLGETICGVHYRDLGLDTRLVRIFNTYGPRMDINDGRVIPNFIKQALAGEALTIYGDGQQTRSYCYVSDLVAGIVQFAGQDSLAGETINLGNPGEYTILETAQAIAELVNHTSVNSPPQLSYQPLPKDDPLRRKPDITKAQQLLQWSPSVDLKTGLQATIAYFQQK